MVTQPMIGRRAHRVAIDGWLGAPQPRQLCLVGSAGIGKTTLWQYAIDTAAQHGRAVVAWPAASAEQQLSFAGLGGLLDAVDLAAAVTGLSGPRRTALTAALGLTDPPAEPLDSRLVGLALTDVLRCAAAARPLVVAVDDLQWLDAASTQALAFAARRLDRAQVRLLLAHRDEAGCPFDSDSLPIAAMNATEIGRVIRDRLVDPPPRPVVDRVHAASGGNPFVAVEMARWLRDRPEHSALSVPVGVLAESGTVVADRLSQLSPAARTCVVLTAMAAEPRLDLLERALGAVAADALDEACGRGFLRVVDDRVAAVHPLYTATAYGTHPPGQRRNLHRTLARICTDPVERAQHLAATTRRPSAATAQALADAGDYALRRGAPAAAAELYAAAAGRAPAPATRGALLVAAGQADALAGNAAGAKRHLSAALALADVGPVRMEALLAMGELTYVEQPTAALPLLQAALPHAPDEVARARVHAYITAMADMDPEAANTSAEAAAALVADRPDAPDDQVACALLDHAFHCLLRGEAPSAAAIDRGLALRQPGQHSFFARRAQELAERITFHFGRLDEARAIDEQEYQRLLDFGEHGLLPPMAQTLSVLCLLAGDWPAARRYANACADFVAQGAPEWQARASLASARVLAYDGHLDEAAAIARPALAAQNSTGDRWESAILAGLLGFIELSRPDPTAALVYLTQAQAHADAMAIRLPTQFRYLGDLVEAAVLAGDLNLAERCISERLEESADRQKLPWSIAMARRGRGQLCLARADLAAAVDWLDQAIAVYDDALPLPFERARTVLYRGIAHRRAGQRRSARLDLAAAAEAFVHLGAGAWAERSRSELSQVGGRTPGPHLTAAEARVAHLAAAGRSNQEIAAALSVSVRTVEGQLSAVFRKLRVRSRSQVAAALRPG